MADVPYIPEGYPRVCPYLLIDGASEALGFYTSVLGATERVRMPGPEGTIGHAEIQIGDSVLMLADLPGQSPKALGGSPVHISVYVDDVDTVFDQALEAGAKTVQPVEDKFYGDRTGGFEDPWGHVWFVMTHVEDVSPEEMAKRAAEAGQDAG
jgi:PhnB protein